LEGTQSTDRESAARRVVIIDDHQTFAEALRVVIEAEADFICTAVSSTLTEGLGAVDRLRPDIALVDVFLPDGDGIDAVRQIRARHPDMHLVVMTGRPSIDVLAAAVDAGASGFVSKARPLEVLLGMLRTVDAGAVALEQVGLAATLSQWWSHADFERLTPREAEILQLMATGLDPKTIARRLHISAHTSRGHVKRILTKLQAHTQLEAVVVAARHGLIRLRD
jgi:DNA-binding NarL/FixJ family response regulator